MENKQIVVGNGNFSCDENPGKEITESEEKELSEEEDDFHLTKYFGFDYENDTKEQFLDKVKNKLGDNCVIEMQNALSKSVIKRAEELSVDCINIAPFGAYNKILEEKDLIINFLKTEAHKPDYWNLFRLEFNPIKELIVFYFYNSSVDTGETLSGLVFTTKTGKIKHAFAKIE